MASPENSLHSAELRATVHSPYDSWHRDIWRHGVVIYRLLHLKIGVIKSEGTLATCSGAKEMRRFAARSCTQVVQNCISSHVFHTRLSWVGLVLQLTFSKSAVKTRIFRLRIARECEISITWTNDRHKKQQNITTRGRSLELEHF